MAKDRARKGRPARDPKPPTPRRDAGWPDFDLAALQGFDPGTMQARTPIGGFILVLATIFNDLKDAMYASVRLREESQRATVRSPASGQLGGMANHAIRIMFGVLNELMAEIHKHRGVVDGPQFSALVAGLGARSATAWQRLTTIASREDDAADATSRILVKIRAGVSYHYSPKVIAPSYDAFFAVQPAPGDAAIRDRAILSDGHTMETTRFYFADAAVTQALVSFGLEQAELARRLAQIASDVNVALKHIVMAYVRSVATLSSYASPGP